MRNVVVTTNKDRRGVFGGQLVKSDGDCVTLKNARMAVYWSTDVHGVLGLAANGPSASCKITPCVPKIELNGVTSIMDMTDAAKEAWDKEPWARRNDA